MFVCNGLLKLSVNESPELAVLQRHHPNGGGRIVDAGLILYSLVTDFVLWAHLNNTFLFSVRIGQCEEILQQHGDAHPVVCVCMDIQGSVMYLQVLLGECVSNSLVADLFMQLFAKSDNDHRS
jgi:hypothetical protein